MSALISIVVPVYNVEGYVRRCFESVTNQTWKDFEVIVIDDGSMDKSGEICDEYAQKDTRFKVFHQSNQGIGKTRLGGIKKAVGEYVVWADADDWLEPSLLERLVKCIREKKSDIVVYGAANVNNKVITSKILWKDLTIDGWRRETIISGQSVVWNFMSKRSLYEDVNLPEAVHLSGEDGYLTITLFFKAKSVSYINEVLYFHFVDNPNSVTHTMNAKKYYAHCYLWNYRREMAQMYDPLKIDYCAVRALSNGVKAFCLSLAVPELDEVQLKEIDSILQHNSIQSIKGRYRDRFLAWCLLAHKWMIPRFYGHWKSKKLICVKKNNEVIS